MVTVKQSRPEIYFPAERPAGAVVTSALECLAAGIGELRSSVGGNYVRGVKGVEMRNVSVMNLILFIVIVEFKQLTFASGLEIGESCNRLCESFGKPFIFAENFARLDAV
ncbi:MAG: hypothetical protein IKS04_06270, partial [Clostridia bacterium]|nr:hypothetical protein [Clostridia bacterium]